MATLLSLPTEILCQIAEHVDDKDLSKMRLVCKLLHDAANKPFGITYFAHRHHILSTPSIRTLLKIVTHPSLGLYVKSLAIEGCYPVFNSREDMRLMKRVFDNIGKHQNSVHINIRNQENYSETGWSGMLVDQTDSWAQVLDHTLVAAVRVNCHVSFLELSMHHYKFEKLQDALEDLLHPTRPPLRLTINCDRKRTRYLEHPYSIIYDQADASLKLVGFNLYELSRGNPQATIKLTFAFLLSQTTQLIFEQCHLCSGSRFRAFLALGGETLSTHLTSVHMRHFRPCITVADVTRGHWSELIWSLSELSSLKHFVIEDLHSPEYWALFHLPSTTVKHEISSKDVAEQLEALASLVAVDPVIHSDPLVTIV